MCAQVSVCLQLCMWLNARLSMFIYASMHNSVCVWVWACVGGGLCVCTCRGVCVYISRSEGSTDVPSRWTQWITYRPLSQTRPCWPLVYSTLIGPSAEVTLPSPLFFTDAQPDAYLPVRGYTADLKHQDFYNCLCGFVHVCTHVFL